MKTKCFLLLFLLINTFYYSQTWTWVNGYISSGAPSSGSVGVPSGLNTPGCRGSSASVSDLVNDVVWIFGGGHTTAQVSGYKQDLWKYNTISDQWTYVKGSGGVDLPGNYGVLGVGSPTTNPGSRLGAVMWIDNQNNLWLFGGYGLAANNTFGNLNDLWKFDTSNNIWTWISGSNAVNQAGVYGAIGVSNIANKPGARHGASGFKDPYGNLCLFGGFNQSIASPGSHNDLWRYSIATNQWTWLKGSNLKGQFGIYGVANLSSASNLPGGRSETTTWIDLNGNLWMFGGIGNSSDSSGYLNDLWKYSWSTNEWTWVKGNNQLVNQMGNYGVVTVGTPTNLPGSRWGCANWIDNSGSLWLYGGIGYGTALTSPPPLCDLWKYDISSNTFTWMKGNGLSWQTAVYGTQGIPSPQNNPGGRAYSASWKSSNGDFWLFGGHSVDGGNNYGRMSDVWKMQICTPLSFSISATNTTICEGDAVVLNVLGGTSYTWSTFQTTSSIVATPTLATNYFVAGFGANGCISNSSISINVINNMLSVNGFPNIICPGQSATLIATGCNTYTWNHSVQGNSFVVTPSVSTIYQISGFSNGCLFSSSHVELVYNCVGIEKNASDDILKIFPNPAKNSFTVRYDGIYQNLSLILLNPIGQKVFERKIESSDEYINTGLTSGLYIIYIFNGTDMVKSGKLLIE